MCPRSLVPFWLQPQTEVLHLKTGKNSFVSKGFCSLPPQMKRLGQTERVADRAPHRRIRQPASSCTGCTAHWIHHGLNPYLLSTLRTLPSRAKGAENPPTHLHETASRRTRELISLRRTAGVIGNRLMRSRVPLISVSPLMSGGSALAC